MMRHKTLPMKWKSLGSVDLVVQNVLLSWHGTPYRLGVQVKKMGVDCVHFVAGVLDELFRQAPIPLEKLPPDMAFHQRASAIAGMKRIMSHYPWDPVRTLEVEAGDVLVCGAAAGGPGHAMIVGGAPGQLWHADSKQVSRTGYSFAQSGLCMLHRICRPRGKKRWVEA